MTMAVTMTMTMTITMTMTMTMTVSMTMTYFCSDYWITSNVPYSRKIIAFLINIQETMRQYIASQMVSTMMPQEVLNNQSTI